MLPAYKLMLFSREANKVPYPTRVSPESSVQKGAGPRDHVLCVSVTGTIRQAEPQRQEGRGIWGGTLGEELRGAVYSGAS